MEMEWNVFHNNMDDKHPFFHVRHGATVLEELTG